MSDLRLQQIDEAVDWIRGKSSLVPAVGVILGSGLGDVVDAVNSELTVSYSEIPNAPMSGVAGHMGRLCLGTVEDVPVAVMQGRVHYYEGWSMTDVVFMPRVLGRLGVRTAIVTNAAGGSNRDFSVGDLMMISDHINFIGENPLRGPNIDDLGLRFPDMSQSYPADLREKARDVSSELGLALQEGVYLAVSGPSYETPAEIRAFQRLGADAIGMSTIPEVIAFSQMAVPVLGISCITNMAAGILPQPLTHEEVMDTTARVARDFTRLLISLIVRFGR